MDCVCVPFRRRMGKTKYWSAFERGMVVGARGLWSPCPNELMQFWGVKGVKLNIRKLFLMFYTLSVLQYYFWQYLNIIFVLVGCTCTRIPVFLRHCLFSIFFLNTELICFQHFYFHDWSKVVFSWLSLVPLQQTYVWNVALQYWKVRHRFMRIAIDIISAPNYREIPGDSQP